MSEESLTNWRQIEADYRAGIKALRLIGEENGVTEGAIRKRAKRDEWTRDLTGRIQAKAEDKVRKEEVRKAGTHAHRMSPATEREVVDANAEVLAHVDLLQRKDVTLAMETSRGQLQELADMSEPQFRTRLEQLGDMMDQSTATRPDKANELYRYIISLSGRIKMSKDVAATHGVYLPLARKIYKLDAEADKGQTAVDALMAKILSDD